MTLGRRARSKGRSAPPITNRRVVELGGKTKPLRTLDNELIEENYWLKVQQERFRGRV